MTRFILLLLILLTLNFVAATRRDHNFKELNGKASFNARRPSPRNRNIYGHKQFKKHSEEQKDKNVNPFIDFVLNSLGSMVVVNKLQPYPINDTRNEFAKEMLGLSLAGKADLYNGTVVDGLESVHRIGTAFLRKSKNETHFTRILRFEVELTNVKVATHFTLEFLGHGPYGNLSCTSERIQILIELGISSEINDDDDDNGNGNGGGIDDLDFSLETLKVVQLEPFEFKVRGIWTFNFFANLMSSILAKIYKKAIIANIEQITRNLFTQVVEEATSSPAIRPLLAMSLQFL